METDNYVREKNRLDDAICARSSDAAGLFIRVIHTMYKNLDIMNSIVSEFTQGVASDAVRKAFRFRSSPAVHHKWGGVGFGADPCRRRLHDRGTRIYTN